jgi:tetratricopeptide (TPR) repeat protein
LQGHGQLALERAESARNVYQKLDTSYLATKERDDTYVALAVLLYNLAEMHLEMGNYDPSNKIYDQAMEYYEKYNIIPHNNMPEGSLLPRDQARETIREYEDMLEQYEAVLNGNINVPLPPDLDSMYDEFGNLVYVADEGYEGDIHAQLGSTYMSLQDDDVSAKSHLHLAIQLYDGSGNHDDPLAADAKWNLAILHFRNSEFKESAAMRRKALEIYQLEPKEDNPLFQTTLALNTLLQQHAAEIMQEETPETATSVPERVPERTERKEVHGILYNDPIRGGQRSDYSGSAVDDEQLAQHVRERRMGDEARHNRHVSGEPTRKMREREERMFDQESHGGDRGGQFAAAEAFDKRERLHGQDNQEKQEEKKATDTIARSTTATLKIINLADFQLASEQNGTDSIQIEL